MLGIFIVPCAKWGRSVSLISWMENTNGRPLINWSCLCFLGGNFLMPFNERGVRVRAPVYACVCMHILGT